MSAVRWALGALGVLVGAYGGLLLWQRQRPDQLVDVAVWWATGVVLHDVLLSAVVVLVGVALARVAPVEARAPLAVGGLVLGSATLAAVPVLLAFGRRADNPTLLDRPYLLGWCALAGVVALVVLAVTVVRRLRG